MSLNGLDDVKVREAYDAAISEPGGWFLLKYVSRDEIDILGTGNGGITDIRSSIARYEEPSPLYGFLRYRRRSVIIKYIPEDCSRLLQAIIREGELANSMYLLVLARAAVHFNAICDQFAHNTTFEITDAKDLKDSKLSAACSLHAASGSSSSSSSSLRRRRLNEIAEEEEEEERERKRQSVVKEEGRPTSSLYSDSPASPSSPEPPVVLDRQQITNPTETTFASTKNVPDFTGADVPVSPTRSEFGRRLSSQSARPEIYSSASYYQGKKVKLGPRPSMDAHKRPSTAENFRPIAALPAGLKFFKGSKKDKSKEQGQNEQTAYVLAATAPAPELRPQSKDGQLPPRPATSSGASIKSTAPSMAQAREGKLTPEKARLMKAMKLREKKMQDAKLELSSPTKSKPSVDSVAEPVPNPEPKSSLSIRADYSTPTTLNVNATTASPISGTRPDTHSRDVALDSHPSSPGAASSTYIGDSTKASSLSDLTDETIQASKEPAHDTDEAQGSPAETLGTTKETDPQRTPPHTHKDITEPADTPQLKTIDTDVSNNKFTGDSEEFSQIPVSNTNNSQSSGSMIRKFMEHDDFPSDTDSKPTLDNNERPDVALTQEPSADLQENEKLTPDIIALALPQVSDQSTVSIEDNHNTSKVQLGIPQSKFASSEAKSPTSPISPTTPDLKSRFSRKPIPVPSEPTLPALNETIRTLSTAKYEPPKPEVPSKTGPEILLASPPKPLKQKVIVEPICTDLPAKGTFQSEHSDPLDDDALMDELQTATVQEAKPITVSKSPITPVFPNSSSPPRKDARVPRAASNPMRGSLLMPVDVSQGNTPRSVSSGAAFLNNLTRNPSNASIQSKKSNVGSSISQRIKALEALSGNPNEDRPRPTTPSSTFFTVRKQGTRDPSKSPSVVDRANTITYPAPAPESSRETTPEAASSIRERSGSVASRLTMFEGQNAPRGRPESIQVTARIIRGATSPFTNLTNTSRKLGDAAPAEFRQSTLLVDVHRAQSARPQPLSERPLIVERPKTSVSEVQEKPHSVSEIAEKQARRRSSLSLMRNFIKEHTPLSNKSTENLAATSPRATPLKSPSRPPSAHQTSTSFVRRLSTSSRRSSFNHEGDNASVSGATRSSSRVSDNGSTEDDKSLSDKKSKNRTSRFMRRLSNSFGGARKSGSASISPTVTEEDTDQLEKAAILAQQQVTSPTIVAFMGDVNVQFPDNLLWKRRSMCLDAQGFLMLSTIQGGAKKGKDSAGTKRFHLGDFRKPYIPDVEVQELPNSVLLDFLEGSSLQIACGDRSEQQKILRTLQEAHQSHTAGRN
ncbi:hypothetical protein O1611_g4952 [Lasiodiplodia mahajangana]|uniref:Uncharacterized protein n=1 Tax=Lasiodiplodia mahajangana TaxID=1108764 RepID=A0ACC2JMJ0_9PEZI|nr:hypothetical protein O1611_g4952 [Lasiodiplodia mahajangana]